MLDASSKILIVDDMRTMLKMVRNALQDLGFPNVTEARNANDALGLLKEHNSGDDPFKLIISDWNMPDMDGIQFLKTVRSDATTKDILFLMLTANRGTEEMNSAKDAGANGFMSKPFSVNDLGSKLKELVS